MNALKRLFYRFVAYYAECEAYAAFESGDTAAGLMMARTANRFAQMGA